jgi:anion-transporting  ArsA/GET3 family ATPase
VKKTSAHSFAHIVSDSRIIVCCGSGGVGKTTTAAALAIQAANNGRKVVLITIDPAKRLADALGLSGLTNEPAEIETPGNGQLWAMMLDARATFDGVIRQQARNENQIRRILDNPFYNNIASRLSGSQEYMAAEKLYELFNDTRFDLVVVDTPPTREALDFLDAPQKLMNFLDHRVYRWLVAPARGGLKVLNLAAQPILRTLGRVIGADVLTDAVDFFQAFEGIEKGFRQRAEAVQSLLQSPVTKYIVVTTPRQDTVAEAIYFADQLDDAGIDVTGIILNRLQPTFGAGSAKEALTKASQADMSGDSRLAILYRNVAHLRQLAEAEGEAVEPLLKHADQAAVARLFQRSEDVHDLATIAELGHELVGSSTSE